MESSNPPALPDVKSVGMRVAITAGAIGILALVLPVIWFAFLSTLGIIGILGLGMLGLGVIKALPLIGQKYENKLLALQIAEAEKNPISQMWRRIEQRSGQLEQTNKFLSNMGGKVGGFETLIKQQMKDDPGYDATDEKEAVAKMRAFYDALKADYQAALLALGEMKTEFKRKQFKWGFAGAASEAMAAMSNQDAANIREEMLKDVSFQAVENKFNETFAKLDLKTIELNSSKQLSFGKGAVIDVSAIHIPTAQSQLQGVAR